MFFSLSRRPTHRKIPSFGEWAGHFVFAATRFECLHVSLNFSHAASRISSCSSNERIAKTVMALEMALDYSEDKLEITLETQAVKAHEAATKEGGGGAMRDMALHMPRAAT